MSVTVINPWVPVPLKSRPAITVSMEDEAPVYGMDEVLRLLREGGMRFDEVRHDPVYTIDDMLALDMPDPDHIAKNLFLRDDKKRRYYLVVCREDRKVDLKALRTVIGSRPLSMASEDDLFKLLGLRKGAVTPFGLLNHEGATVDLVIDRFFEGSRMGIHPNDNRCTVWVSTDDVLSLVGDRCGSYGFYDLP